MGAGGKRPCLGWIEGLRCVETMKAAYRSADADGPPVDLPLRPELELEPGVVESSGLAEVPDLSGLVGCRGFCELASSHVVALTMSTTPK